MGAGIADLVVAAAILLTAVSLLLFMVGALSYRRTGQGRLAWVAVAFLAFTVQGGLYVRDAYRDRGALADGSEPFPVFLVLDLLIVLALYLAVLRR